MQFSLNRSLHSLSKKFDSISERERKLLFYGLPLTLLFVALLQFIEPAYQTLESQKTKLAQTDKQIKDIQNSIQILTTQLGIDPNTELNSQIERARTRIASLDRVFNEELNQLVQPSYMPILLEQMINEANGLSLLSLNSVPPVKIFSLEQSAGDVALYQHRIKLVLEGNFFAVRDFLRQTEDLGWRLYWPQIDYEVKDYPNAQVSIDVATLSTSEEFISVL
jgi:MSHA biogenesis protein MshJ